MDMLEHLHAMHQRCTTTDGRRHVQRLGHLLQVGALLQGVLRVRVDAIGALYHVRDRQGDQRLLARRERAGLEYLGVVIEELVGQLLVAFADGRELRQVLRLVVGVHDFLGCKQKSPPRGRACHANAALQAFISRAVMVYLKLSGSRLSRRSRPVSAWGYMRKPTAGPLEPGSFTSWASL